MILTATGIEKSFGTLPVLRGIDLQIEGGLITSIVGASGAGKTTLLQILGTLMAPDRGRVLYDGVEVTSLRDRALSAFRGSHIGFVFQNHQLLPEFTALENVMLPALIGGRSKREARVRALELLDLLGLAERTAHKPAALSGGEKQRVAVARALAMSPDLVFADEPTGSLDTAARRDMQDLFMHLRDTLGQGFVIVTHDPALAASSDRVLTMSDGKLL